MKMNRKKIIIVLFVILALLFLIIEAFYLTRTPIYIVSDTLYYNTTIKFQKNKLKFDALLKNKKLVFVVDEKNNGKWASYDYKEKSTMILSPYISMMMEYDDDINFNNNIIISIDNKLEKADININIDYLSGYEKLGIALKDKGKSVYLLSSKVWPTSISKAVAFEKSFTNVGLTKIELEGNELEQSAYDIIDRIRNTENVEIVSTGSTLVSYLSKDNNSFLYNLEALQSSCVDANSIHYIIYEDLSPLLKNNLTKNDKKVLKTNLKDYQEGLINFFLHLLRDLESSLF